VIEFVDGWLEVSMPQVTRWQYDDNAGERSILLFHVHVFIETRRKRKEAKLVPRVTKKEKERRRMIEEDSSSAGVGGGIIYSSGVGSNGVQLGEGAVAPIAAAGLIGAMESEAVAVEHSKERTGKEKEKEKEHICGDSFDGGDGEEYEYILSDTEDGRAESEPLLPFFEVNKEEEYFPPHTMMHD
jgi:hypothetical protein